MKKEIKNYSYTECGLDNIILVNGVIEHDTGYGPGISIPDLDALHKLIGLRIIDQNQPLIGAEIKFLRHELDLSQKAIAMMLGVGEQTFARWEKGTSKIPGPAQKLLAAFYRENVTGNADVSKNLKKISELDSEYHAVCFELSHSEDDWKMAS